MKWISDKAEVRNEPTGAFKALITWRRKFRELKPEHEANRLSV